MRIFCGFLSIDRNAFRSTTEVGFRPVEMAEHQGCCGRIPPESSWNRNPALDSGTPTNLNESRNVQPSPFPYGDHRMETGIDTSPFPYGDYQLPYRDSKQVNPHFHMGIPLTHPHFHMGTIQSLTCFHMVSVTIWEFRKKSPYENKFPFGFTGSIW